MTGSIDHDTFERGLDLVRTGAADPVAGVFGPGSMTWRVDREAALFLGAGRALLLQLAHPHVAVSIAEHSRALADPVGRFHRTFGAVFAMVFGTLEEALRAARGLHKRHALVMGTLPEAIGVYEAGSPYLANHGEALAFVHATLAESALVAHDLLLPPLTSEERERYWAESRLLAALFGVPAGELPATWADFAAEANAKWRSDTLAVGPAALRVSQALLNGPRPWLRAPGWYLALTAILLPPHLAEAYGLPTGEPARRSAERALGRLRHIYPLLPARLRYVGPYHEATGRLAGRATPDHATALLNLLWIGRARLGDRNARTDSTA